MSLTTLGDLQMMNTHQDQLLTEAQVSGITGFSKNTLRAWRVSGRSIKFNTPPYVKCGRSVRYRASDLQQWMNDQRIMSSTSEVGAW